MNFNNINTKILNEDALRLTLAYWKFKNHKIVFTNGCFDIIHRGHIEYLAKAADLGNILIIGLNSDTSVKRLKGNNRPIIDQESRAIMLSALQFINGVVYFEEDTPYELIKFIKPDILIKGSDYNIKEIVGADIVLEGGGEVKTIDFIEGHSTSNIIQKLEQKN